MNLLFRISYVVVIVFGILILIPNLLPPQTVTSQNACVSTLRAIQEKKTVWAETNGKGPDAIPTAADLFGTYVLADFAYCPAGGVYTIGSVGTLPRCSAGHVCPQSER